MTTLTFCSDASGGGQGWQDASGCACLVSLARQNRRNGDTDKSVVVFTLALHLPEELPVSSKIGEWLGLMIGLWEVEHWLDDYQQQQQENDGSSLEYHYPAGNTCRSSHAHTSLTNFFFPQKEGGSSLPRRCLEIVGDSQSLIQILRDERALDLIHVWEQPVVQETRRLVSKLSSHIQVMTKPQTKFTWIPRNENKECDALSKKARKETETRNVSAETCQRAMSLIRNQVIPRRNDYVAIKEERDEKKREKKRRRIQAKEAATTPL